MDDSTILSLVTSYLAALSSRVQQVSRDPDEEQNDDDVSAFTFIGVYVVAWLVVAVCA
jgi:hypothetical protein